MKHIFKFLVFALTLTSCSTAHCNPSTSSEPQISSENSTSSQTVIEVLNLSDVEKYIDYQYTENDIKYLKKGIKEVRVKNSYNNNRPTRNVFTIYYDQDNRYFLWFELFFRLDCANAGYCYVKDDFGETGSGIYNPSTLETEFYYIDQRDFSTYRDQNKIEQKKDDFFDDGTCTFNHILNESRSEVRNHYYKLNVNTLIKISNLLSNEYSKFEAYKIDERIFISIETIERNIQATESYEFETIAIDKITEHNFELNQHFVTKEEVIVKNLNYLSSDTSHPVESVISNDSFTYEYDVDCYFEIEPVDREYFAPYSSQDEPGL